MKNLYLFLLIGFLALINPDVYGQSPRVYFDTVYANPPAAVTSKLYFENIPDVATISLLGHYKSSALSFYNIPFINPVLGPGLAVNFSFGDIAFAWFGLIPVSFNGSNVIFTINFNYLQDSSKLSFDSLNGALSSGLGANIPVTYIPGYVLQCPTSIISDPITDTVLMGNTATFSIPPMGHTITYQWQQSSDNGNTWTNVSNTSPYFGATSNQLSIITQAFMNQYLFRCVTGGACGITSFSSSLIVNIPSIKGKLTYNNLASTPLASCQVSLKQGGVVIAQSFTTGTGDYEITNFPYGNYVLEATIPQPWGGVNATDALLITKHYVGLITLTGLPLLAADVNSSGFINSADALMTLKRVVGLINAFPSGNWITENPAVSITAPVIYTVNLKALCTGDVNASYIP